MTGKWTKETRNGKIICGKVTLSNKKWKWDRNNFYLPIHLVFLKKPNTPVSWGCVIICCWWQERAFKGCKPEYKHVETDPLTQVFCFLKFIPKKWFFQRDILASEQCSFSVIINSKIVDVTCMIFFFICSEFCHTLKWNSHGSTCVPHPDPPSHLVWCLM